MRKALVGVGCVALGLWGASCAKASHTSTVGGAGDSGSAGSAGSAGSGGTTGMGASGGTGGAGATGGAGGTGGDTGTTHTGGGGTGGMTTTSSTTSTTSTSSTTSSTTIGECNPGDVQPCFDGPGKAGVGQCVQGKKACDPAGKWGACMGAVYASAEICDGLDNDCNGMVDEGCSPVLFQNLIDYDAAGDKSLFAIGGTGMTITGKCWKGDGTIKRDTFTVVNDTYMGGGSSNGPDVVTARKAGTSLVTWCSEVNGFDKRVFRSQLFDAQCMPVGGPFNWPGPPGGEYDYDTAMDAMGNFVIAWKDPTSPMSATLHVTFYDKGGAVLVPDLVAGTCDAQGTGYAYHVALNQVTGAGFVSCQGHEFNVIRYRRFDVNHAWIDPAMVDVAETKNTHSSWYESHAIGMNDLGQFTIEWEDATDKQMKANFYDASGTLLKTVSLGPTDPSLYFDAFRYPHQAVQLDGGDFLYRDDPWNAPQVPKFWRYTSAGAFVGCGTSMHKKYSLRTGSGVSLFMADGDTILPGALDVSNANCN